MGFKTYLDVCRNNFWNQGWKLLEYLKFIADEIASKRKDTEMANFFLQHVVIRLHSYFEEYLKCLIFNISVRNIDSIIKYFEDSGSDRQREQIKKIDRNRIAEYGNLAAQQASFMKKGKKLKKIFEYLFGFPLFPDENTERMILDLVLVRNIIIHAGGSPTTQYAKQIRTPGVILVTNEIKNPQSGEVISNFYKLELGSNSFILNVVKTIEVLTQYIHSKLEGDPKFDLKQDNFLNTL